MSDNQAPASVETDDDDAISWKDIMAGLRAGQTVEIPVGDDQEFKRRQRQLERRAERQGLQLQITRDRGLLRAAMTGQAASAPAPTTDEGKKDRASREERRAQRRAERAASAGE
ncbi:MAG TPA: hypothetical protein VFQ80_01910 [Thermomicrobiales bacterium]|jgi:hypothetical protein|nr:hypothetical protein [Thermomicrobiales bacterium]